MLPKILELLHTQYNNKISTGGGGRGGWGLWGGGGLGGCQVSGRGQWVGGLAPCGGAWSF